jgi:hypothetical protein
MGGAIFIYAGFGGYEMFDYVIPQSVLDNPQALAIWRYQMLDIQDTFQRLTRLGIPIHASTGILPACVTNVPQLSE